MKVECTVGEMIKCRITSAFKLTCDVNITLPRTIPYTTF